MKSARFFCESCGRSVPFNANMCPHCGKKFDAVKCPVCKYTGMPGEFLQGCPKCGYLASEDDGPAGPDPRSPGRKEPASTAPSQGRSPKGSDTPPKYMKAPRQEKDYELFAEEHFDKPKGFHNWSYYFILVLLFGILISMGIFLVMIM